MISYDVIESTMYEAMRRAAVTLPPDVEAALRTAMAEETEPLAREHLQVCLENARLAGEGRGLVCGDTGFPLYFVTAGSRTQIEGGFGTLRKAAQSATARVTEDAFLRPTMVDPLSRANPGRNVGPGMPKLELTFSGDGNGLEIVAAPKGGGSEIFGTFYRMLFPADGEAGILKFVLESIQAACYAGKICPPAIVGVGIGGSADLCMRMAKEASVLRPVGKHHPDPRVARHGMQAAACHAADGDWPHGFPRNQRGDGASYRDRVDSHRCAACGGQCPVPGRTSLVCVDCGRRHGDLSRRDPMSDAIHHLQLPITEEEARSLTLGTRVTVSGPIFTGRSRFHIRAVEQNLVPPLDFQAVNCFFHVGPVMRRRDDQWEIVSIEPTSSIRFDRYSADVIRKLRLRTLIGKTTMGPRAAAALAEVGGVYLTKIGVCGNQLTPQVKKVRGVYFLEELGKTEATWVFEVEQFGPFFVAIDAKGNNYFEQLGAEVASRMETIYRDLGIPDDFGLTNVNAAVKREGSA